MTFISQFCGSWNSKLKLKLNHGKMTLEIKLIETYFFYYFI